MGTAHVWSAAHQPVCATADWYHAQLATDRVTFHRREHGIETRTEVVVVPEVGGFEVIRRRTPERMPAVVFLTAFDQFAIRAFDSGRSYDDLHLAVDTELHFEFISDLIAKMDRPHWMYSVDEIAELATTGAVR